MDIQEFKRKHQNDEFAINQETIDKIDVLIDELENKEVK